MYSYSKYKKDIEIANTIKESADNMLLSKQRYSWVLDILRPNWQADDFYPLESAMNEWREKYGQFYNEMIDLADKITLAADEELRKLNEMLNASEEGDSNSSSISGSNSSGGGGF